MLFSILFRIKLYTGMINTKIKSVSASGKRETYTIKKYVEGLKGNCNAFLS